MDLIRLKSRCPEGLNFSWGYRRWGWESFVFPDPIKKTKNYLYFWKNSWQEHKWKILDLCSIPYGPFLVLWRYQGILLFILSASAVTASQMVDGPCQTGAHHCRWNWTGEWCCEHMSLRCALSQHEGSFSQKSPELYTDFTMFPFGVKLEQKSINRQSIVMSANFSHPRLYTERDLKLTVCSIQGLITFSVLLLHHSIIWCTKRRWIFYCLVFWLKAKFSNVARRRHYSVEHTIRNKHFPTSPPSCNQQYLWERKICIECFCCQPGQIAHRYSEEGPVRLKSNMYTFALSWFLFGLVCLLASQTILRLCKIFFNDV